MSQCEPKRDREDELDPVILPEVKPPRDSLVAPSASIRLMAGPLLTAEIEGEFVFMVDTGAMVSLIKPETNKAQLSM